MNKESTEKDAIRMKEYDETESETESVTVVDVMNKLYELDGNLVVAFDAIEVMEERLIAIERALEGIERKAKMVRRDADSGGDTEWY